jgi:hypothetical protein
MDDDRTVHHAYHGQSVKLSTGTKYTIVMHKPRNVEILSANSSRIKDDNLRVFIKADNDNLRHIHKEKGTQVTSASPLPRNQQFTIVIPQSEQQPVFNFFPEGNESNQVLRVPLESFLCNDNNDPIKIFLFDFNSRSSPEPLVLNMSGDTSYLNGITFTQVTENDSTLLFGQEMESSLDIQDGPVNIDDLSGDQCKSIVEQVIGKDFDNTLDRNKVEKGEGKQFWDGKQIILTSVLGVKDFVLHRHILRDFGFNGKFYVQTIKEKQYVIFRGYKGMRKWYSGTRYRATNPKVVSLTAKGALKSGLEVDPITLVIVGAVDIIPRLLDKDNEIRFSDMCVTLGMDILKAIVGTIIAAGIAAFVLSFVVFSAPVWIVVGGTIVLGILVGWGLDFIDQKTGATDYMKERGRDAESFLDQIWHEHIAEPFGKMYYQLEKSIENLYYLPVGSGL